MKTFTKRTLCFTGMGLLAGMLVTATTAAAQDAAPKVAFQTSLGSFVVELDRQRTPKTVENFLRYVREGHYDGTVIYRVVPGFVIQAGSVGTDNRPRADHDPIPLETANALSNTRGTLAMARESDPNTARAEFFINLSDNLPLDRRPDDTANQTGYTGFGRVVQGMEVVDAIAMVPLGNNLGPFPDASPATPVVIQKATITN